MSVIKDSNLEHAYIVDKAREIAVKYLQPKELRDDPGYMADAVAAVEVWVQVTVIAKAFMKPSPANTRSALMYVLCGVMADNLFWRKANNIISPVLANALLKMCESYIVDGDYPNKDKPECKDLIMTGRLAILDVYGVIMYALGGYSMAASGSIEAKKEMYNLLFSE
jgi:hypothetical protein